METLIIIFCIIASLIGFKIYKDIYNPITPFFFFWAIIIFFSTLRYFEIDKTQKSTYIIILFGLLSYFLGCMIYFFIDKKKYANKKKGASTKFKINYGVLYFLYGFVFLYLLINTINVIALLTDGYTMEKIRSLYVAGGEYNEVRTSFLSQVIKSFISTPVVYLAIAFLPIEVIKGRQDKIIISLTLLMTIMWVMTSGGRSVIIWIVLYFIVALIIYNKEIIFTKKQIIIFISIGILFGYIFIHLSLIRRAHSSFFRDLYIYFSVPIVHFDHRILQIEEFYNDFYGYGLSSLNGFIYPVLAIFKNIGIIDSYPQMFETARYLSFQFLEDRVSVGGGINMNAFATMFYQFYLDGRIIGVIIGSSLFGVICTYVYSEMRVNNDEMWVLLYLLLFQKLMFSQVRFYFTQPAQAISFALVFIIFYNYDYIPRIKSKYKLMSHSIKEVFKNEKN